MNAARLPRSSVRSTTRYLSSIPQPPSVAPDRPIVVASPPPALGAGSEDRSRGVHGGLTEAAARPALLVAALLAPSRCHWIRPAVRLIAAAMITTPNTYDRMPCTSTTRRR